MTMAVWRGYCGTGGKPAGNREDKLDPNQPEKSIYSTLKIFATEAHGNTRKKNALLIEYFRVLPCASVAKQGF